MRHTPVAYTNPKNPATPGDNVRATVEFMQSPLDILLDNHHYAMEQIVDKYHGIDDEIELLQTMVGYCKIAVLKLHDNLEYPSN